ncbi:MAG: hypothetical protein GKR94_18470 [Gammaproteobacteria bacterium]|nr:hypothetical protein [Gammaproteobacteria bacterium]
MPVWKFRAIEQMPPTPSYAAGSAAHVRHWAALWARATALANKRFESGVFRYRAIDDRQRDDRQRDDSQRANAQLAPSEDGAWRR